MPTEKKPSRLIEAVAVMLFTAQAVRVLLAMLFARVCYDIWLRGPVPHTCGLEPLSGRVLDSLASDHRMVVVEAR